MILFISCYRYPAMITIFFSLNHTFSMMLLVSCAIKRLQCTSACNGEELTYFSLHKVVCNLDSGEKCLSSTSMPLERKFVRRNKKYQQDSYVVPVINAFGKNISLGKMYYIVTINVFGKEILMPSKRISLGEIFCHRH